MVLTYFFKLQIQSQQIRIAKLTTMIQTLISIRFTNPTMGLQYVSYHLLL